MRSIVIATTKNYCAVLTHGGPRWIRTGSLRPSGLVRHASSDGIEKEVLEAKDCGFYIRRKEIWRMNIQGWNEPQEMIACYSPIDDSYIGDEPTAKKFAKHGIVPEKSKPDHNVASIGFSEKEGKWYGWSHRAWYGWGVGDEIEEGVGGLDLTNFKPGHVLKNLDEAKQMAVAFAESVS